MSFFYHCQHPQVAALIVALLTSTLIKLTSGHGRLLEPPARNTLWRFGFKAPANYNDNELFCGGIRGITNNEGKCGVCGDPYDGVRVHETGNAMALNETTRVYFPGSTIDLMVEVVANHGGQFRFEMCWRDSFEVKETEDCFEPLRLSSHSTRSGADQAQQEQDRSREVYELDGALGPGMHSMSVELPLDRSCERCVFRWHWKSANNWGKCEDGSEKVGCGYQEVYRNCADVAVKRNGAGIGLTRRKRR